MTALRFLYALAIVMLLILAWSAAQGIGAAFGDGICEVVTATCRVVGR